MWPRLIAAVREQHSLIAGLTAVMADHNRGQGLTSGQPCRPDRAGPFLDFVRRIAAGSPAIGVRADDVGADLLQPLLIDGVFIAAIAAALSFWTIDAGVPFGRKNASQFGNEILQPLLLRGGEVGKLGERSWSSSRSPSRSCLRFAGSRPRLEAVVVDPAGDQVLHRRPAAAIRHVRDVDADRRH